jgi:protein phosphatase
MKWAQITDKGLTREVNEDNLLIVPEYGLLAIADGMGGHRGGKTASNMALRILEQELTRGLAQKETPVTSLLDALKVANAAIYSRAGENAELKGMGTTVTACLERDGQLIIAHIGDSRAYISAFQTIRQVTQDHTYVRKLVQKGQLSERAAKSHPHRHVLEKALGAHTDVKFDYVVLENYDLDAVLLCTDGLNSMVEDKEIMNILAARGLTEEKVQKLIDLANHNGGTDNISLALFEFGEGSDSQW